MCTPNCWVLKRFQGTASKARPHFLGLFLIFIQRSPVAFVPVPLVITSAWLRTNQCLNRIAACCFLFPTPQVADGISPFYSLRSFRAEIKPHDDWYSCSVDPLLLMFWPISSPVSMLTSLLTDLFQKGKGEYGFLFFKSYFYMIIKEKYAHDKTFVKYQNV